MKVRLLVSRAGPTISQNAGDIIETSDLEGETLVKTGQAEFVEKTETATKKIVKRKAVK